MTDFSICCLNCFCISKSFLNLPGLLCCLLLSTLTFLKIEITGQREEGKKSMQWLRGPQYNIEREMAELEARVRVELSMKSSFGDLLRPWAFKPLLVAVFLMVFQQLSGINAALFNAVRIFNSAGSDLDPLVSAVLLNVTQVKKSF